MCSRARGSTRRSAVIHLSNLQLAALGLSTSSASSVCSTTFDHPIPKALPQPINPLDAGISRTREKQAPLMAPVTELLSRTAVPPLTRASLGCCRLAEAALLYAAGVLSRTDREHNARSSEPARRPFGCRSAAPDDPQRLRGGLKIRHPSSQSRSQSCLFPADPCAVARCSISPKDDEIDSSILSRAVRLLLTAKQA